MAWSSACRLQICNAGTMSCIFFHIGGSFGTIRCVAPKMVLRCQISSELIASLTRDRSCSKLVVQPTCKLVQGSTIDALKTLGSPKSEKMGSDGSRSFVGNGAGCSATESDGADQRKTFLRSHPLLLAISGAMLLTAIAADARGPWRASEDNTRGWQFMTSEERIEHQARVRSFNSLVECRAYQQEHHRQMEQRAKDRGKALPETGRDICAHLKPAG